MIFSDHGNVEIEGADHTLISDLGSIIHVMLRNGFQIEDELELKDIFPEQFGA